MVAPDDDTGTGHGTMIGEAFGFGLLAVIVTVILVYVTRKPKWNPQWRVFDGETERVLDDTDEGKLFKTVILKNTCPDCGNHQGFYAGPCGGMSQNIFCQNRECRSGFNVTAFDSHNGTAQRIGKGDIARYPAMETLH
jgi:hypothetical protein